MKKLLLLLAMVATSVNFSIAQNQGVWQANGQSITYTNRNVGIKTNNPLFPLQVTGEIHCDSMSILGPLKIGGKTLVLNGQVEGGPR